jgi:hypothetical protein
MQVLLDVFCHLKHVMLGGDLSSFETCSLLLKAVLAMLGALPVISRHLSPQAPSVGISWVGLSVCLWG